MMTEEHAARPLPGSALPTGRPSRRGEDDRGTRARRIESRRTR